MSATATQFRDPNGRPVDVESTAASSLRGDLAGALAPGDRDYETVREIWNAMIDRRPALIVPCSSAAEVVRCVEFARRHGVGLSVRGGGHNVGGRALVEGGVMVDFSGWTDVRYDPSAGVADVAPGATLADVDRALVPQGGVVPAGVVSETGIAGLTLGGGFGWLSRRWGLTCDHLVEVELVTTAGATLTVDEASHPELFWALRGGGGGFGIVTRFRFRVRPFEPTVQAGPIFHRAEARAEAAARYLAGTAGSPETLGCMLKLCAAPPAPFLPEAAHGTPVAVTIACHSGDPERVEGDLASLRTAEPLADLVEARPFDQFQGMFDAGDPKGRRNYWKSEYVSDVDDEMMADLLARTEVLPSPAANVKVFHLGGAVARVAPEARYIIVVATGWEDPADDEANIQWARETWAAVHARSGRGGYVNFLPDDRTDDETRASLGGVDLARLAAVKRAWDPEGLLGRLV